MITSHFGGFKGEPSYDEKHYDTGIIRIRHGDKFKYIYAKTKLPVSGRDAERITTLKIPPGWESVWISGDPNTDIQVLGKDAKGKKQYLYSDQHIKNVERQKFIRLYKFLLALPKLNNAILKHQKDINPYSESHVVSTILILVKELHFRVGKEQYVRENNSYGVSSLRKSHIKIGGVNGDKIKFDFVGKSKQKHSMTLIDATISEHMIQLLKLEGKKLFQFIDDGNIKKITDVEINKYIQKYMGEIFTVKDFRTYAANHYFVQTLLNETMTQSNDIKKNVKNAIKISAQKLGHSDNISKKSYIMSYCVTLYTKKPDFFIKRKFNDPDAVLLEILKNYIK